MELTWPFRRRGGGRPVAPAVWRDLVDAFPAVQGFRQGIWLQKPADRPQPPDRWAVVPPDLGGAPPLALLQVAEWDYPTLEALAAQPWAFVRGRVEVLYVPRSVAEAAGIYPGRRRRAMPRWLAPIFAALAKLKLLLAFGSMLLSMALYALLLGWKFAVGLVLLIAVHESGHVIANRRRGIPASWPIFIPFLGAFVNLHRAPLNAEEEAYIGIAGPVFGLAATAVAALLGAVTGQPFWAALVSAGCLLHVFNLMPVLPLDGGRTVSFWRWLAWIPGGLGALIVLFYRPTPPHWQLDPVAVILVALVIVSLASESRRHQGNYDMIRPSARWVYTLAWAGLLALSVGGYILYGAHAV